MFIYISFKFYKDLCPSRNKEWRGGEERDLDQVTVKEDFINNVLFLIQRMFYSYK